MLLERSVGHSFRLIVSRLLHSHLKEVPLISRFAIPVALLIMISMGFSRIEPQDKAVVIEYHEHVAELINSIPIDFDGWIGRQVPLPQSAVKLLNPNATVARHYVNREKGVDATLMFVHCKDARDMAGHYPPVCYPASGWLTQEDIPAVDYSFDQQQVPVYGFARTDREVESKIAIYSLFALPTGELTTSMRDVRKLSADYQYRQFGAAQLQVVINGDVSVEDHQWIVSDLFRIARPAIEAVLDAVQDEDDVEGDES